jgi:hypothetical protein
MILSQAPTNSSSRFLQLPRSTDTPNPADTPNPVDTPNRVDDMIYQSKPLPTRRLSLRRRAPTRLTLAETLPPTDCVGVNGMTIRPYVNRVTNRVPPFL